MSYESLRAESIGWWECQSGGGGATIADLSTTGKNGYLDGIYTIPTTTGPNERLPLALDFTGRNSWVRFDSPFTPFVTGAAARTFAGWGMMKDEFSVKPLFLIGQYEGGGSPGQQFQLRLSFAGSYLEILLGSHVVRASLEIELDVWRHYAVSVPSGATSTSQVKAYVDGSELALGTYSGSPQTLSTAMAAYAGFAGAGIAKFNGPIAGFASFNRELSAAEIMTLITGEGSGGDPGGGDSGGGSATVRRRVLGLGGNLGLRR